MTHFLRQTEYTKKAFGFYEKTYIKNNYIKTSEEVKT